MYGSAKVTQMPDEKHEQMLETTLASAYGDHKVTIRIANVDNE